MARVPSAIWVVDTKKEHIAVNEARKLGIPVVAILDTNCDPDEVNYPIPGNDDAIRSVALLTRVVADAVADGLIAPGGRGRQPTRSRPTSQFSATSEEPLRRVGARPARGRSGPMPPLLAPRRSRSPTVSGRGRCRRRDRRGRGRRDRREIAEAAAEAAPGDAEAAAADAAE